VVEMRADQRSDIFSLGSVLFEMLTGERLFTGESTSEILERVVAGEIPKARSINPLVPEPVEAILSRALERASARRFPSAAAMGEACEHFLYDKGYGPTNLTLKHYLGSVFGAGSVSDEAEPRDREPTLIPLGDEMRGEPFDDGAITRAGSPLERVVFRGETPRPGSARTPPEAPKK